MWKPKTYICQHVLLTPSKTETQVHNGHHSTACRRSRYGKGSCTKPVESKSENSKGEPQQTLPGFHLKWEWSSRKAVCVFHVHTVWLTLCLCVFYWVWTVWTRTTCPSWVHAWPAEDVSFKPRPAEDVSFKPPQQWRTKRLDLVSLVVCGVKMV